MREKGFVAQLQLVLEWDPVPGFMESHGILQDHDFEHFLGFREREFAMVDEGGNVGV